MTKLISAISPLKPISVTNIHTGELLGVNEWSTPVGKLLHYVQQETKYLFDTQSDKFIADVENSTKLGSMNSFARQRGYTSNYKENLPVTVKAKSRVNELVLHKFASETASYVLNQNPQKPSPTFAPKINLGAVDKQMVTLSLNNNMLTLVWKVWDQELMFEFKIPHYILKRNISKYSLPTVQYYNDEIVFIFTIQETPMLRTKGKHVAGIDLGRVEPYTMSIVNSAGGRVAHYYSSGRIKQLNNKRERLLVEKKHILNKISAYKQLGLNDTVLVSEKNFKSRKIKLIGVSLAQQLGAEVTKKLVKHDVNVLNVENLTWVTGVKYGSRWNHSAQQVAVEHSALRVGIKTRKVNPKNTSQTCYKCGTKIVHNTKIRSVHCVNCKTDLDRDYNAAMNIALIKSYPIMNRVNGNNLSEKTQVVNTSSNSIIVVNNNITIASFAT